MIVKNLGHLILFLWNLNDKVRFELKTGIYIYIDFWFRTKNLIKSFNSCFWYSLEYLLYSLRRIEPESLNGKFCPVGIQNFIAIIYISVWSTYVNKSLLFIFLRQFSIFSLGIPINNLIFMNKVWIWICKIKQKLKERISLFYKCWENYNHDFKFFSLSFFHEFYQNL